MSKKVEKIKADGNILAIVIRCSYNKPGTNFMTPDNFPFQIGVHIRKAGSEVKAHRHIPFRDIKEMYPQEFFYVENGKIEVGLYNKKEFNSKIVLNRGDMIILNCPHELRFLDTSKIVELKQGPYRGKNAEKEYF